MSARKERARSAPTRVLLILMTLLLGLTFVPQAAEADTGWGTSNSHRPTDRVSSETDEWGWGVPAKHRPTDKVAADTDEWGWGVPHKHRPTDRATGGFSDHVFVTYLKLLILR